jgi:AcrR family transcriptional regulator
MSIQPPDSKYRQTERAIEQAYLALCLEQGRLDVTVSEVVSRAGIGRSTFYLHFNDVAGLAAAIQERLLAVAEANMARVLPDLLAHGEEALPRYFEPVAQALRENRQALLVFLGRNGSPAFIYRVKQTAKVYLRRLFAGRADERTEYLIEYMVSAGMGLIIYWLEDDMALPYETLLALLGTILVRGPLAAGLAQ